MEEWGSSSSSRIVKMRMEKRMEMMMRRKMRTIKLMMIKVTIIIFDHYYILFL
jgi:hypothetical protein